MSVPVAANDPHFLHPTEFEDVVKTILRARKAAQAIGLSRVVACLDYAYVESLYSIQEVEPGDLRDNSRGYLVSNEGC